MSAPTTQSPFKVSLSSLHPETRAIVEIESILQPFDAETGDRIAAYFTEKHGVAIDRPLVWSEEHDPATFVWTEGNDPRHFTCHPTKPWRLDLHNVEQV